MRRESEREVSDCGSALLRTFENTAENPETDSGIFLGSESGKSWTKQGVYKVTGYICDPGRICSYLTAWRCQRHMPIFLYRKRENPQINTYSMPVVDLVEFPMLMAWLFSRRTSECTGLYT